MPKHLRDDLSEDSLSSETAIAVFAYNRVSHLRACLESLALNSKFNSLRCFIFVDGARNKADLPACEATLRVAHSFSKEFLNVAVISRESNLGLRNSIIRGVSGVLKDFSSIIVVEDDLLLASNFLDYMLDQLEKCREDPTIGSIAGYREGAFPPFIVGDTIAARRQSCWGWATWKNRWEKVDWNTLNTDSDDFLKIGKSLSSIGSDLFDIFKARHLGDIESWAIDFDSTAAKLGWRAIHPRFSFVENQGFDGSGTNFNINLNLKTKQVGFTRFKSSDRSIVISGFYDFWLKVKFSRLFRFVRLTISRLRNLRLSR